ncbi:energy transducer TonB [Sphingomonas koreensis]
MKPEPIERIISLALAALIPAVAGVALLLTLPPGDGGRGGKRDGGDGVLVVEMLPLETASASMATGAPPPSKASQAPPLREVRPAGSALLGMPLPAGGSQNLAPPREEIAGRIPGDSVSSLSGSSAISYRETLLAHIARYRRYPADARRDHVEGTVEVRFVLDRAGAVQNAWIAASSGRTNLDAEALAAIRRAAPMPKIPSELPDSLDITLPIDFEIG